MKKLAAVLVMASGMALAPMTLAPAAQADVCAAAGGRHFSVGGCTNVAGDAAAVAIASQDYPYVPNEIPCYTVQGTPYYTPPGYPC
jgi:hypothetical protein